MQWYHNLRLRTKLVAAFGMIVVVMAGQALLVVQALNAHDWGHARSLLWLSTAALLALGLLNAWLIDQSVAWPERIEASSAAIVAIVHAMDDVATQTNVLALNAAIEAARAG
ncbi:MAG TPA: methyl-accepting chemotaxis protein, partial [Gemmatimonadaceae bacterium]|nr:methyl-accepting chemotaxis protein [Gemmatimonadaceae bacterium]